MQPRGEKIYCGGSGSLEKTLRWGSTCRFTGECSRSLRLGERGEVDGAQGGVQPLLGRCDKNLILSQHHQLLAPGTQALGSGGHPREETWDLGEPGPFYLWGVCIIPGKESGQGLSASNSPGSRSHEGLGPRRRDVGGTPLYPLQVPVSRATWESEKHPRPAHDCHRARTYQGLN